MAAPSTVAPPTPRAVSSTYFIGNSFYAGIKKAPMTGAFPSKLIVGCAQSEVCLGMIANRANLGSTLANVDMAAVAALPNHVALAGEYQAVFDVGQQFAVALFVLFFNGTYLLKQVCNVIKAFLFCLFCEEIYHRKSVTQDFITGMHRQ